MKQIRDFSGWIIIGALVSLSSCSGCKKDPKPIPLTPTGVIEATAKPVEDSLRHEIFVLRDSISILKTISLKSDAKKEVAKEKKQDAGARVQAAEIRGDSLAIINSLRDEVAASEQYIKTADEQSTVQGEIITKYEGVVVSLSADNELQKSKFKQLANAFTVLQADFDQAKKDLGKANKKNALLKFFVKVFGIGTAAALAMLAILFL